MQEMPAQFVACLRRFRVHMNLIDEKLIIGLQHPY